jgi:thiol-disulfide isomerase/thioredoxin
VNEGTTQSVDDLRSHAERGNEGAHGRVWPLLVLLLLAAATLVAIQLRRPKPPDPFVGVGLPPLEAAGWLNAEKPLTTEVLRGNVVLIDFWSTDCPKCVSDMPDVLAFRKRFAEQGVKLVGLTHEPTTELERVKQYVETAKIDWPIGYGAGFTYELLGIRGTPTYILFDRTGRSVWGGHTLDGLDDAAVAALAK